jgi:hypothetical protein
MDRGVENSCLICLFTQPGWTGNIFLPEENRIGSDFEETCRGAITLQKLADIENAARRALTSKTFSSVEVDVSNSKGDCIAVRATLGPGGALSLTREGALWRNEAVDPAERRL